ncbi:MAG: acyl-CoA dehydrogenase family protein [Chloroflexi bacterium]|nr:acyl-CoA dehydrogenase family protein [Chloroflexota bacterium]
MNLDLTEQHLALRQLVRDFMEKEFAPVAQEFDDREEFPVDIVKRMGQLGILGIAFPEEYGGGGYDAVSYVITIEEISRVDSSMGITVEADVTLGGAPLNHYGTEEQKRIWLAPLAKGQMLGAFGLTEPEAGSDSGATRTTAVLHGDEWVINGTKCFITNSGTPMTGFVNITAVTGKRADGKKEISTILVPSGTPGFTVSKKYRKMGWRASDTRELSFADCRVPKGNLVGRQGAGLRQFLETLDEGRLGVAAMGVGLAQGALEMSLSYAKQRVQFGRPIFEYQEIQSKLVNMAINIEAGRLLCLKAALLKDRGVPYTKEAAMAKMFTSEHAVLAASEGVQIHGGLGLMDDSPISRFYRDAKFLAIGEGTTEIQKMVIARRL